MDSFEEPVSDVRRTFELFRQSVEEVRVLVVGDLMLDWYIRGKVIRISPEAPVQILEVEEEYGSLGGAGNAAANVAALGGQTTLVGFLGEGDDTNRKIRDLCEGSNINLQWVPAGFPSIVKNRYVAGKQQLLRVDWDKKGRRVNKDEAAERNETVGELLDEHDVVLVSDYASGFVDGDLMRLLRESGKEIIVDPKPRNLNYYGPVTLLTPNKMEAMEMVRGCGVEKEGSFIDSLPSLRKCLRSDLLVTLGEDGIVWVTEKAMKVVPTESREVYDVTGAGDSVIALVALSCAIDEFEMTDICALANLAGGVAVSHVGTVPVSLNELEQAVEDIE